MIGGTGDPPCGMRGGDGRDAHTTLRGRPTVNSSLQPRDSATRRLLRRVAGRQRLAAAGSLCFVLLLVLAGVYGALFVASRLLGLVPDWFEPVTLLVVPAAAVALAAAFHRGPRPVEVARRIDRHADTRDLFLTATLLDQSPGDFKPIVARQAEERAGKIAPAKVAPYQWGGRGAICAAVLGALLLSVRFVPQLDPFGKEEQRKKAAELERDLAETKKATALRIALLKRRNPQAKTSEQARHALDELKKTFKAMKPTQPKANLQRLRTAQERLDELWRRHGEKRLKDAFDPTRQTQTLGAARADKAEQWKRSLRRGDPSELQKEIAEIKRKVAQMQQAKDPAQRAKIQQEVGRRLGGLKDFLASNATARPLDESARRALEQLTMADNKKLSKEALEALKQSLDLTKNELDNVAQAVRDLQALEEGLRAAQLARRANQAQPLDGKGCEGCKTIADYAAFYKQLMEGAKTAKVGPGMGSKGIGKGGEAPEKPEEDTDFTPERSRSAFQAGKVLLQWKTRKLSDPGSVKTDYKQHIHDVKQGVSEAILHEQVPPGYHDAIKKYFDALEEAGGKP